MGGALGVEVGAQAEDDQADGSFAVCTWAATPRTAARNSRRSRPPGHSVNSSSSWSTTSTRRRSSPFPPSSTASERRSTSVSAAPLSSRVIPTAFSCADAATTTTAITSPRTSTARPRLRAGTFCRITPRRLCGRASRRVHALGVEHHQARVRLPTRHFPHLPAQQVVREQLPLAAAPPHVQVRKKFLCTLLPPSQRAVRDVLPVSCLRLGLSGWWWSLCVAMAVAG